MVAHTYEVMRQTENIRSAMAESEAATRGFLITGDARWENTRRKVHHELDSLIKHMGSRLVDPSQQQRLAKLKLLIRQKQAFQASVITEHSTTPNSDQAFAYDSEGRKLALQIQQKLVEFMDRQNALLHDRSLQNNKARQKSLLTSIIGVGLVFCFVLITLWRLNKDIRRRKRAEEGIRKSELKYRKLIEDAGVTVFTSDLAGNFTYVSGRALSLTGFSPEELIGRNFTILVAPQHLEQVTAAYVLQAEQRIPETTEEFPIITHDGLEKWVEQNAILLFDEENNVSGFQCIVKDITEKRNQNKKIREADRNIRAMLQSSQEGFYMIDKDHRLVMINEAARTQLQLVSGYRPNTGDSIVDYLLPERKEMFTRRFDRVLYGTTEESDARIMTSSGEMWFNSRYFPVKDESGEPIAVCVFSKDVTERILADRVLQQIRAEKQDYQFRLQSILDNTPLIVFVKDLEGRYLIINQSFREAFNRTDTEVLGKTDFDFSSSDEALRYQAADVKVIETLQSVELEETVVRDGVEENLLIVKFPLFDKNQKIYGVGCIATDYTDKVKYRRNLLEAKKKAESAEQLQEQFLANMSHEIRTPMNGIIGMANVLLESGLNEEQMGFAKIIRQSSDNLLFLLNDILDLSKIKSGKLMLEHTPFTLYEVVDSAIGLIRQPAKEKQLVIHCDFRVPVQTRVEGDPYRLSQILNNLLSNALKFTEQGSITVTVEKATQDGTDMFRFTVADTGIGIPENKTEGIFNSFEQANKSTTRQFGGTGLGLAITRQLVLMQHGAISVNSTPGKGTSFIISIPYTTIQTTSESEEKNVPKAAVDFSGKSILVVEDNLINQQVIHHILKRRGVRTTLAGHGREAVDILERGEKFDAIIMDLQMPEMDGYQTTTYIRCKLNDQTPIIAMTASALRNEKIKCLELGMNDYLTKPFAPADLFDTLQQLLFQQQSAHTDRSAETEHKSELYSLDYLKEMEDEDYTREVLELFLGTTPTMLQQMDAALLEEDWTSLQQKAHKLKSSFGILQMNELLRLSQALEDLARSGSDRDGMAKGLKQLIEQYNLIKPMIEAECRSVGQIINPNT